MDGLLIDSERLLLECMLSAAPADCDRERLKSALLETLGVTDAEMRRILRERMDGSFSFEACEKRAVELYFSRIETEGVPVRTGARALLTYLAERGCRIGLASSSSRALVEKELGMAGLLPFFHTISTGDMVKLGKPAPDIYLLACRQLGVAPETAYAVEDAPKGIEAAAAAGLMPLMVPDLAPATEELSRRCTGVFDTLLDVLQWVKACESKESD